MIVQSDYSIFLETQAETYEEERDFLALFAQLEKSPEYIHTYRITLLSLWNAAAIKVPLKKITDGLTQYSKFTLPSNVLQYISNYYERFGKIKILDYDEEFYFLKTPPEDKVHLKRQKKLMHILEGDHPEGYLIRKLNRGTVKQALMEIDPPMPVEDLASFKEGSPIDFSFKDCS